MAKAQEEARSWRVQGQERTGGRRYYALVRGSLGGRKAIALGYVTVEEAERARVAMQVEEEGTAGTGAQGRCRALGGPGDRKRRAVLVRELVDGTAEGLAEHFGPEPVRHDRMTLRDYWGGVFWKVRTEGEPGLPAVSANTQRGEKGYWKQILEAIGDVLVG